MSMRRLSSTHSLLHTAVACAVTITLSTSDLLADNVPAMSTDAMRAKGAKIYAQQCADCHGESGEGVEGAYDDALIGDSTVGELTKIIHNTMPEGEAELCRGPDAQAVAAFIHHAFYSEAARIRNRPPQISLSRLTGTQLRQSLADLYGHFTGNVGNTADRGLKGIYFDGARWKNENKKIERVDDTITFDFGHDGPGEGIKPEDFFIQWNGGLKVDVTGRYEILVDSTCAFVLKLGNRRNEFINNRIQSGDRTEFRKSVMLTAGRVYPLQIDFYQRKRKTEQPPARITLAWTPPGGVEHPIPRQQLIPAVPPSAFSLQTPLPADDRSYGYERGLSVDRQWDEAVTSAAIEFGQAAAEELWPDYERKHKKDPNENRQRLRDFLGELVSVAFRSPLDEATRKFYVDDQVAAEQDDAEAIKRCVLVSLKSPRFLYPTLDIGQSPSEQAASRLALTLFDSLPSDQWLITQAGKGQLHTEEQIRKAAWRMVSDYRTQGKTRQLMYEWLNLGHHGEITKSSEHFPDFDAHLVSDLKRSLDTFLDDVVWSETSDFRQLLLADWSYTTPRVAEYYGEAWAPEGTEAVGLVKTTRDAEHRFGVITHPYLMSALAYHDSTSPIHRGVFLIRYMLGRTLRPPQEAFTPLSPDLHPEMTTRERVELQTSPESCQVCHTKINGLGFTLENFDAVGRFRLQEGLKSVDARGGYTTRSGEDVTFNGPNDLAEFLVNSDDVHRAFVNRAFHHFVKQPIAAYDVELLDTLTDKFRQSGFKVRDLLVEIAVISAMHAIKTDDQTTSVEN